MHEHAKGREVVGVPHVCMDHQVGQQPLRVGETVSLPDTISAARVPANLTTAPSTPLPSRSVTLKVKLPPALWPGRDDAGWPLLGVGATSTDLLTLEPLQPARTKERLTNNSAWKTPEDFNFLDNLHLLNQRLRTWARRRVQPSLRANYTNFLSLLRLVGAPLFVSLPWLIAWAQGWYR